MEENRRDQHAVRDVSFLVAHSLTPWIHSQKRGSAYVLGNEHYIEIKMGESSFRGFPLPKYSSTRAEFIQERLTDPAHPCTGFIPATNEALEDLSLEGMDIIAKGLEMTGFPGIPDGSFISVYGTKK